MGRRTGYSLRNSEGKKILILGPSNLLERQSKENQKNFLDELKAQGMYTKLQRSKKAGELSYIS